MLGTISVQTFGLGDALQACRNLQPGRWAAAGLCVLLGLSAAGLLGTVNAPRSGPAQVVALSANAAAGAAAPADAMAAIRDLAMTPTALAKVGADLNLAESGLVGDKSVEAFLGASVKIAPSERAAIININVDTGAPAFDALIANHIARGLAGQNAATATKVSNAGSPMQFSLVAKARVVPPASVLLYQVEIIILSLLLAASVLALGVARELRARRKPEVVVPAKPAAVVPRGILEQIDMLERMWPETGRQNAMPEGSNDEPEQVELQPARNIVIRMAELRQDARKAIHQPSEEAMEDVLTDMQSLRDQVRWITAEQLRRRRRVNSFGR